MSRTIRVLAAPVLAALLLAGCGGTDDAKDQSAPTAQAQQSDGGSVAEAEGAKVDFAGETYAFNATAMNDAAYPTAGKYLLEGGTGVRALADIGVEGPDELEALRKSYDADPVTYIRFDVDNRNGSEEIGMYGLTMYDEDGKEYAFKPITDTQVDDWEKGIEADEFTDEQIEARDAVEEDVPDDNASIGQRNEQWLIGPGDLPETVAVMHAQAEGFADEFDPLPLQ